MDQEKELDLVGFFEEMNRESERGLALVAAAQLEDMLFRILKTFLCDRKATENDLLRSDRPLGNFSARIDACFALGLIDEYEYRELTRVRQVRDEFAHKRPGLTFADERVRSVCGGMVSPRPVPAGVKLPKGAVEGSPRFRFTNAVAHLTMRLYQRDVAVAAEQRVPMISSPWEGWQDVVYVSPGEERPDDVFVEGMRIRKQ